MGVSYTRHGAPAERGNLGLSRSINMPILRIENLDSKYVGEVERQTTARLFSSRRNPVFGCPARVPKILRNPTIKEEIGALMIVDSVRRMLGFT